MPRFAILEHDSPRSLHWDLMLEYEDRLRTWALESAPVADVSLAAEALADYG